MLSLIAVSLGGARHGKVEQIFICGSSTSRPARHIYLAVVASVALGDWHLHCSLAPTQLVRMLRQARLAGKQGLIRALFEITSGTLSRSVAYVGIGIAVVAVAQAALWLGAQW